MAWCPGLLNAAARGVVNARREITMAVRFMAFSLKGGPGGSAWLAVSSRGGSIRASGHSTPWLGLPTSLSIDVAIARFR
jgi:hypothetical protein